MVPTGAAARKRAVAGSKTDDKPMRVAMSTRRKIIVDRMLVSAGLFFIDDGLSRQNDAHELLVSVCVLDDCRSVAVGYSQRHGATVVHGKGLNHDVFAVGNRSEERRVGKEC